MKTAQNTRYAVGLLLPLACFALSPTSAAAAYSLAQYPLFLATGINPNVLIVLDNSGSMDEQMSGTYVDRTGSTSRSNTVRSVLRNTIASYRYTFNWGLMAMNAYMTSNQCNSNPYYTYQNGTTWVSCANAIGIGTLVEGVQTDSTTHYNNLMSELAAVGSNVNEVLNGDGTPSYGSMFSAGAYFAGTSGNSYYYPSATGTGSTVSTSWNYTSPITATCQKNYVVFATDGEPNMDIHADCYAITNNTCSSNSSTKTDLVNKITAMRSTVVSNGAAGVVGSTFDVQTYVIGVANDVTGSTTVDMLNSMASAGGTGSAYFTSDTASFKAAMASIVASIQGKDTAAASVAVASTKLNTSDAVYQAIFDSKHWAGNLLSYPVTMSSSGTPTLGTTPTWQAAAKLETLVGPDGSGGYGWNTKRKIITYNGSKGVPFRWPVNSASPTSNEISSSQVTALNTSASGTTDSNGSTRLNYLRGDSTNEDANCSLPCTLNYRDRKIDVLGSTSNPPATTPTVLGDITESGPIYVGKPSATYYDSIESVAYSSFASTYASRTPVVYVGANDGMLHGFNASTGDEVIAYVPSKVFSNLTQLTDPGYSHLNYVDGDPNVGDVFYSGAWHTLLASGYRSGATGIFALDVTDPSQFSESNAANIVRWEYGSSNDSDMGYIYGQPLLVKVNSGKWAVIVGNGYNSANYKAVLFVLDAQTGALIKKIDTGATGTSAAPNGLSAPTAVDTNGDGIADVVYAGDLQGNMWKFDLSSTSASSWGVAFSGSALFAAGSTKPITSAPGVGRSSQGGFIVTFGTGSFITSTDVSSSSTQTLYGIWDKKNSTSGVSASNLTQQNFVYNQTVSGNSYWETTHAVGAPSDVTLTGDNTITSANFYSTKLGWYLNLPNSGERVTGTPQIDNGQVQFTSYTPVVTSCSSSGSHRNTIVMLETGNRPDTVVLDTNQDGSFTTSDNLSNNGVANSVTGDGLSFSSTTIYSKPKSQASPTKTSCNTNLNVGNASTAVLQTFVSKGACGSSTRAMWRQTQ